MPTNIEVVQSLHDDLDQEALKALKEWRFEPGMKDGKAVLVQIQVNASHARFRGRLLDLWFQTYPSKSDIDGPSRSRSVN